VLEAVRALEGEAADPVTVPGTAPRSSRAAANEARWSLSGSGWRGAVAACLIASTALVVVRLREEPGTAVEPQQTLPAAAPVPPPLTPPAALPSTRPAASPARLSVAPAAAPPVPLPAAAPAEQPPPAAVISATQAVPPPELREQSAPAARAPAPVAAAVGKARADDIPTANGLAGADGKGSLEGPRQAPVRSHPDAERDADGRTALALAVLRGDVPMVKWLLARGAQPQVPDRFGQTPLGYAEAGGDPAMRQAFQGP
jgi:hypothetical protein